ncbi:MAG: Rv3235 family protein [Arcanobacterium sp.]|nr:Rv3235 family protein [Arcanobacterium sp.]MDY5588498.1 Rv3235 family protein [Arcanobacterium sp.]
MSTQLAEPLVRHIPPRRATLATLESAAAHAHKSAQHSAVTPTSEPSRSGPPAPAIYTARTTAPNRPVPSPPSRDNPSLRPLPTLTFRSANTTQLPDGKVVHDGNTTLDSPLPTGFPAPDNFAAAIARQGVEALLGLRPPRHLQSWFTTTLYHNFTRRVALTHDAVRAGLISPPITPVQIVRIRCTRPRIRVAEAAVILKIGSTVRASALRLEVRHGRWQVCAFEVA